MMELDAVDHPVYIQAAQGGTRTNSAGKAWLEGKGVMVGADVSRVAEIDVSPLFPGHRLDFRVFLLEPPPHQRLIAFDRSGSTP